MSHAPSSPFPAVAVPLLAFVLAAGCAEPVPRQVMRNATWSYDQSEMLTTEARWTTTDPDAPYWHDVKGYDREFVVYTGASLTSLTERARFPDADQAVGGAMLYSRLHYLEAQALLVAREYDNVFVLDLASGTRTSVVLPRAVATTLFGEDDLIAEGLVHDFAPSPNGETLAVFYAYAYVDPEDAKDNLALIRFVHVVAFYALDDATFLGATRLDPWMGSHETLRLDPPLADVPLESPDPPAGATHESLQRPTHFLWAKDSSGVFVVDRATDTGQTNDGAFVAVADPTTFTRLGADDTVPERALQTLGGPVKDDGTTLLVVLDPNDGNVAELDLFQARNWVGYGELGTVPLSGVTYGL